MGFEDKLKSYLTSKDITSAKVKAIDIEKSITLANFEEFLELAKANKLVVFYKLELTTMGLTIVLFFMYDGLLTKYVSEIEKLESKLEVKRTERV